MSKRVWLNNAFWETDDKKMITAILELEDDVGRITRQVMAVKEYDIEGNLNPDFQEILNSVGKETIDKNTSERKEKKKAEVELKKQQEEEHKKARNLEQLFNYKMEACEIDHVKFTKNRLLRSKLRKSKNKHEVDLWTLMILISEFKENEPEKFEIIREIFNNVTH